MPETLVPFRTRINQFADAPKLGGGKLVYVDAAVGDDASGKRGRVDLPFQTCRSAVTAAIAGDTVWVKPGTYNENDLAKHLVNWHLENGAQIFYFYHATDATAIKGIFDVGTAMTFRISGRGWVDMSVDEENPGDAGSQDLHAVRIANASANVTVECRSISASIQLDAGSGGCVLQTAGTVTYNVDNPGDVTVSGGVATLRTDDLALVVTGGTVRAFPVYCSQYQVSGGTLDMTAGRIGSGFISGGTAEVYAGNAGTVTFSGGTGDVAAAVATSLVRTGTGTLHCTVSRWTTSISVQQSAGALTVLHGGYLETTTAPAAVFTGGKTIWRGGEVRENAPAGTHGTDIAIGFGGTPGVVTEVLFEDMIVRCNQSSHSCLRMYDEDTGGGTFTVSGGQWQAGSAGFFFDPEHAANLVTRGKITTNRGSGPFATLTGTGTIDLDSGMNV